MKKVDGMSLSLLFGSITNGRIMIQPLVATLIVLGVYFIVGVIITLINES